MKKNFTLLYFRKLLPAVTLALSAFTMTGCSVVENTPAGEAKNTKAGRREKCVKIYPDLVKRVMHVKCVEESPLDFFVFDQQGTLVLHYKMQEGDHKRISGLVRGSYLYQVFRNDEMSESGKLIIK